MAGRRPEKAIFFVHQNVELSSPLLSAYFIEKLNKALDLDLHIPQMPDSNKDKGQGRLF
ncbi:hypothetical protein KRR40_13765 [Niabella defluvii]|nr:hypothetical protein KRR40_13765 [Niabella sp. I65]